MEGGSDSETKPVDPPPSDSCEELGKKRAHPDDDEEVKSEKRPRLDGEEKMEGEEEKEESKEDAAKADEGHEAEAKVEASVKEEESSPSQPDSAAADKSADSQKQESLPEDVEDGEKDTVMEVDTSDVKEEKPETSEPSSSAKSEAKEGEVGVEEDKEKEKVVVSGSDSAADAPRVKSERETIPNGGVAADRNGLDDRVTVKSDDSEKENQGRETPMDLTRKPAGVTDVITLSDESDEEDVRFTMPNGYQELSVEERMSRERMIKRYQAELRNEEAKLVLLKKLRQSQMTTPQLPDQSSANSLGKASHGSGSSHRQSGGPPPLVRGQQQQQVKMAPHFSQSQSMRSQHGSQSSRSQMHGPPPLVMAPRGSSNSSSSSHLLQQQQQQQQHSGSSQRSNMLQHMYGGMQQPVQAHQPAAQVPPQDTQTPAQRQAAAKLALRKQLEKTLLQIPPPKPPPPEMNFIPSLACPDFILLLGLEEVVNYIIDAQLIAKGEKNADEKFVCNPFTCVQCHSDYTPVWKREKPGSKNVICEQCVTSNQKKALKQEHTNRLKSAFVKALQQEQEIERMQAQSLASTPPAPPAITSTPPLPNVAAAAASPMMPGGAAAAVQAQYKQQQSTAAEQLRQHQNFLQAHQAAQLQRVAGQQMGMSPFGPRGHYPYQLPYSKQSELQRQYLLDMIPRGSMPGWKS